MIWRDAADLPFTRAERGQSSLMMLAVIGAVLVGALVLFAFGNASGSKGGISVGRIWPRSAPPR
jgi:hypothetical protein